MSEMKCLRCGENENRIHGYCSTYCRDMAEYEAEIAALRERAERAKLDLELQSADYKQLLMDVEQLRERAERAEEKVKELDKQLLYRERTSKNNGMAASIAIDRMAELEKRNAAMLDRCERAEARVRDLERVNSIFTKRLSGLDDAALSAHDAGKEER